MYSFARHLRCHLSRLLQIPRILLYTTVITDLVEDGKDAVGVAIPANPSKFFCPVVLLSPMISVSSSVFIQEEWEIKHDQVFCIQ